MTKVKNGSKIYIASALTFLYVPILVLIFFSFNKSKSRNLFTGFTLNWYKQLLHNDLVLNALGVTLVIAAISSICATVLGTAAAVGIQSMKKLPRLAIMNVTYIPVINPEIVTGVSMLLMFTTLRYFLNFEMGFSTLVIAHITFNLPYVILSVNPKLRQLDSSIYDAALDLGCSPRQAFFKVVFPQIMPGITTGFLMALTYSIDDFVISYFTSGTSQTLSIAIYAMTRRKVSPEINALSTLLFTVILLILLVMNLKDIKSNKKGERK
ncbi:MAG: ABC transporter permease [Oscillospiraceae bacterium]|nr:ABC transporter permease [Oscillospiraceae bacterium]